MYGGQPGGGAPQMGTAGFPEMGGANVNMPRMTEAPDMPDMANLAPMNRRKVANAAQAEEEDGGWGDAGALLDWYAIIPRHLHLYN